ncbi:MAG: hypothetical protein GY851_32690, partial [bacterium]|nr:hypothetical protein [bacterium]
MPASKSSVLHLVLLLATLATAVSPSAHAQDAPAPANETFAAPFNIAEAMTDPFLDYFTSTFEQWRVMEAPERRLRVWQDWDIVIFEWGTAPAEGPALRVERDVNLDCARYNRLVLNLSAPKDSDVVFTAETDAGPKSVRLEKANGKENLIRLDLDGAKRITQLRVEIFAGTEGQATGYLIWIVLQNTELLKEYFGQWDFEHMDWSRYLADDTFEPTFTPTYGIFATEDEIEAMRAEHDRQVAESGESQFTRTAARYRDMKPERWIHRYLGKHDEVERTGVEGFDETENVRSCNDLALAAVVLKDKELLRLAVRHALSIAMCEYWCKDFTSNIPGGYREDRSFRRSGYCRTITRSM